MGKIADYNDNNNNNDNLHCILLILGFTVIITIDIIIKNNYKFRDLAMITYMSALQLFFKGGRV